MSQTRIKILATGGTIDKVYFDEKSAYEVGAPQIGEVLERSEVIFDYSIETLCTGIGSNNCVYHAVIGFHVRNYFIVVPENCIHATRPEGQAFAISQFQSPAYNFTITVTSSDRIRLLRKPTARAVSQQLRSSLKLNIERRGLLERGVKLRLKPVRWADRFPTDSLLEIWS